MQTPYNKTVSETYKTVADFLGEKIGAPLWNCGALFWEYLYHPETIGTIAPTSASAAKKVIKNIKNEDSNRKIKILEIGSGSGSITKVIIALQRDFELDAVECQSNLAARVKKLAQEMGMSKSVRIHEMKIQDFEPEHKFDYIICTLPFTSFSAELVTEITTKIDGELLASDGEVSYIEYMYIPTIRLIFHWLFSCCYPKPYKEFKAALDAKAAFLDGKKVETEAEFWNLPPVRIYHCKKLKQD